MKVYYYCSYDGSPVGFHIGRVDYSVPQENLLELKDKEIDPFIRCCFESGLIRSAFGKIPNNNNYFMLKKKLTGKKEEDSYYMNIAIISEDWDEFVQLMQAGSNEEELSDAILDSIKLDKTSAFGYCIDTEKFSKIISMKYGKICGCNDNYLNQVKQQEAFFMTLSTATVDEDVLLNNLGLSKEIQNGLAELEKKSEKFFCYQKKRVVSNRYKYGLTVLLLMITIMATIVALLEMAKK